MKRNCPVCNETKREFLIKQKFARISGGPDLSYTLVICKSCGVCFADDIPSQKVYDGYYKKFSKYEDTQGSGRHSSLMDAAHKRIGKIMASYTPPSASVIDIGCATGNVLRHLRDQGFKTLFGIDPSPECQRVARERYGINSKAVSLDDFKPSETYAAAIMSHVLEHIIDVAKSMTKIHRLLAPKGFLYIEVPAAHKFTEKPDGLFEHFSIEHINYFSPKTLEVLMNRHGFKKRMLKTVLNRSGFYPQFPVIISVWQKEQVLVARRPDRSLAADLRTYIAYCKRAMRPIEKKIDAIIRSKQRIILWGAGSHTLKLFETTRLSKVRIGAIVDDTLSLQGKYIKGFRINSPGVISPDLNLPILISSMHFQEQIAHRIQHQLGLANRIIRLYPKK